MQLYLSPSMFPLTFHCADTKKVVAMIETHNDAGYFTLVGFDIDGNNPSIVMVEKGTLAECLHELSSISLRHEALLKTISLLDQLIKHVESELPDFR